MTKGLNQSSKLSDDGASGEANASTGIERWNDCSFSFEARLIALKEQVADKFLELGSKASTVSDSEYLAMVNADSTKRLEALAVQLGKMTPEGFSTRCRYAFSRQLVELDGAVSSLLALPDGRFLAGNPRGGAHALSLWTCRNGHWTQEPLPGEQDRYVRMVRYSGRYVAVILSENGCVYGLCGEGDGWKRATILKSNDTLAIATLPDGRVLSGHFGAFVRELRQSKFLGWRASEPLLCPGRDAKESALSVGVLSDGRWVIGIGADLGVWNRGEPEPLELVGHEKRGSFKVLPDDRIVSVSWDGTVRIWSENDKGQWSSVVINTPLEKVECVEALPGKRIAVGGLGKGILIYTEREGVWEEEAVLGNIDDNVIHLEVLPNGRLLSGSLEGAIHLWEPRLTSVL